MREPGEQSSTPGERRCYRSHLFIHLHLPLITAVHSTYRIMSCWSILGLWLARSKWAPMPVPFLGCTTNDGVFGDKDNSSSDLTLWHSRPIFPFFTISLPVRSLSSRPLLLRVYDSTFRCYFSLQPVLHTLRYCPSLRRSLCLLQKGRKHTAEDCQRIAEQNALVAGAYEEEDSLHQTKDEDSEIYKANQQQALD
jgi:hypothetical protein